jgi:hypothetical protein
MEDSFYLIFTTPYLFFLTLFFIWCGVGIHNVISKYYHMSDITLISRKICDRIYFRIAIIVSVKVKSVQDKKKCPI